MFLKVILTKKCLSQFSFYTLLRLKVLSVLKRIYQLETFRFKNNDVYKKMLLLFISAESLSRFETVPKHCLFCIKDFIIMIYSKLLLIVIIFLRNKNKSNIHIPQGSINDFIYYIEYFNECIFIRIHHTGE